MALSLASPGIKVREVDLTRGGITNTTSLSAGIAAPFAKGPINQVITVTNENDLFSFFGKPSTSDYHYESWYSASNFLSYGGSLKVVRCGGTNLKNSNAGVGIASTSIVINNYDEYQLTTPTTYYWASKNPGYWAEGVKVCVIDNFADQTISGIATAGIATVGYGITQALSGTIAGVGTTSVASGYLKGIITGVGASTIYVKINSIVVGGTETIQDYTESGSYAFKTSSALNIINLSGSGISTQTPTTISDWYNTQNILDTANGDNTTLSWRSVANKPRTNAYVLERGGGNDAFHVVVIDSKKVGNISGTPQNILEKFINLSKASDTLISPSQKVYYKDYLALNSTYIFAGKSIGDSADSVWRVTPVSSKLTSGGFVAVSTSTGAWAQTAEGRYFNSVGNVSYTLTGGQDYSGASTGYIGGFQVSLSDISTAYDKLANATEVPLNFLLQGSTALSKEEEQAKANKLISIAESRKDCIAFISPYRGDVVNVSSSATQLSNVQAFFSPLTSSSYSVFDSGYQYVYDRFNQQFVYIPCSADVAGLCARTDIDQFPWYSPAGKTRGSLKYAIKLAYNPDQNARDQLYSQRINPIISSPGSGIILFGDKTALSYQSAFDRINVRRLFITIEQAIKGAADAQLFEFNDSSTRANFINIVEPYLRDVQIKRGITDFLLVCDETNNTPDVIDRNEFIADIYVKPARSINFIGLTFVATRTGVSFETVVGTV
jgi:hypothetical protein